MRLSSTERDFEMMAATKGLSEAFSYYADSAATLSRGSLCDTWKRFDQALLSGIKIQRG